MLAPSVGLHADCLELVSVDLEHPLPPPPLRDPPCSYQNGPFGPLPWTCDFLGQFCSELWLHVQHVQ